MTPADPLLHQHDLGQLLALALLLGPPTGPSACGRRSHAAQASQDNEDRSSEGLGPSRLTTTPKAAPSKHWPGRDHPPKVAVPQPVNTSSLTGQRKCPTMETLTLTQKEQARVQVLNSLLAEHMTLDQAATPMGVSARHTRRILAAYRKEGAAALAHGHRGRRAPNTTPGGAEVRSAAPCSDPLLGCQSHSPG